MNNQSPDFWNSLIRGLSMEEEEQDYFWKVPLIVFSLFIVLAAF